MHSNIYQISKTPICILEYKEESDYYEGFINEIADYVDGDVNRIDQIGFLKNWLEKTGAGVIDGDKLTITNKEKFFEDTYRQYKEKLKELINIDTGIKFFGSVKQEQLINDLNSIVNDKYTCYFDDNGEMYGLMNIYEFMRRAENGDVWYLGAVIGYHY